MTKDEHDIAQAMAAIYRTAAGKVLRAWLDNEARTLSAVRSAPNAKLVLADQRSTDLYEGRRWLAVELLGAPNSIEGGKG